MVLQLTLTSCLKHCECPSASQLQRGCCWPSLHHTPARPRGFWTQRCYLQCACAYSLHSLHTFCWPDQAASRGLLWPLTAATPTLLWSFRKPASRKRNQCTPASHRSKYALKLNLVLSLCQWITESAQEAMVSLALIFMPSSQLRTPRNKKEAGVCCFTW